MDRRHKVSGRKLVLLAAAILTLAVLVPVALGEPGAHAQPARAQTPKHLVDLVFQIEHAPRDVFFFRYTSGVSALEFGRARSDAGAVESASFSPQGVTVVPTGSPRWTGDLATLVEVTGASVTGTADFPAGVHVTLTNRHTKRTIEIHNGPFSLATGFGPSSTR